MSRTEKTRISKFSCSIDVFPMIYLFSYNLYRGLFGMTFILVKFHEYPHHPFCISITLDGIDNDSRPEYWNANFSNMETFEFVENSIVLGYFW